MINLEKMIERFKNMFVVLIYVPYLIAVILSLPIIVFIYPNKVKRYGTQSQEYVQQTNLQDTNDEEKNNG